MHTEQKNLLLAIVLSALILMAFEIFFKPGMVADERAIQQAAQQQELQKKKEADAAPKARAILPRDEAVAGNRIAVSSPRIKGSISLKGGRIDDITLLDYRETIDPASPQIVLLSPENTDNAYYSEFGWAAGKTGATPVPDENTIWRADRKELTPEHPVTLTWNNGAGLVFEKKFSLDQNFMLTVEQKVSNQSAPAVELFPYALVARYNKPHVLGYFILHEGAIGVLNDVLAEVKYKDLEKEPLQTDESKGGWLGFTDKYWLVAIAPETGADVKVRIAHTKPQNTDRYQVDYTRAGQVIAPGESYSVTNRLFAGAKEVKLLDAYEKDLGIPRFDLAVDFGWYYFLTKPFFLILHFLFQMLGSFGLAILAFTVLVKAVMFPLANKSYRTMNKLRELQPEMMALREKYRDDPLKQHKEISAFYQRHKVNPLNGCLPILIQIPVFFSLYKVLFVSIEMRHQPFYGWIHDLSAPDPTTIFNLFGLIDWMPPSHLLFIPLWVGAWPIMMGITMFLQQRLNPAPMDPAQKVIFGVFPIFFTFLLAGFPAGLVIYWTWSNLLGILQQYALKKEEWKKARAEKNSKKGK